MGEERERRSSVRSAVKDDGYWRGVVLVLAHLWEVGGVRRGAADIRLVRLGGGQVGHERRHASGGVRDRSRSGMRGSEGLWVERRALCDCARGAALPRGARFAGGSKGAPVAFGHGAGVGEDDYGCAVVDGGGVGEVRLAETRGGGEVHARSEDGGAEREGERRVCGRGWVNVCAVLEAWAEGSPRHRSGMKS